MDQATDTVARLATERPASVKVFQRHGIDFCCGGARPLDAACRDAGVATAALLREVDLEERSLPEPAVRWDQAPLDSLVRHIVERFHRPLGPELPRLRELAETVLRVHGDKDRERFQYVRDAVASMQPEVAQHVAKEEEVVFPWLLGAARASATEPVAALAREHDALGELLHGLRRATDGFTPPPEACATWRALWQGLHDLEQDFHEHVHLENNVLFPRALAGGSGVEARP